MNQNKKIILNKLFPCPPSKNYNMLMIDDDSVSYITTPINSEIISTIIESLLPKNIQSSDITIMDGTACVGGDSIAFGQMFGTVISSEIDLDRYKMLVNNLKVFELYNVIPVNDDCLKIFYRINFIDIMYFDPPWGGKSYKNENYIRLCIGDLFIDEIVNIIFNHDTSNNMSNDTSIKIKSDVKMAIFKLPKNYDIQGLYQKTKSNNIMMLMYELPKILIIVFKKIDY
jgi:16S rRNA G966 N2-methylase RsmD